VKASVIELPAIIRPASTGDDEEQSDPLVEALLENDLRRDLDPLEVSAIGSDATLGMSVGRDRACVGGDLVSSAQCEWLSRLSCNEALSSVVSGSDATLLQ
jgi:hypothetical protein